MTALNSSPQSSVQNSLSSMQIDHVALNVPNYDETLQ